MMHFFGIIADVGNAVQSFIRASMIAVENLFVKTEVVLPGGSITTPSGPNQMAGTGTLNALSLEVFIPNEQVTSSSEIFITPTTLTNAPLVVMGKQDGVGFSVGVRDPQANDISFDWIMMQSYHVGGVDASVNEDVPPVVSGGAPDVSAQPSSTDSGDTSSTDVSVTVVATSSDESTFVATSTTIPTAATTTNDPSLDTTIPSSDVTASSSDTDATTITDTPTSDSQGASTTDTTQ